jgi:hypothetical protein
MCAMRSFITRFVSSCEVCHAGARRTFVDNLVNVATQNVFIIAARRPVVETNGKLKSKSFITRSYNANLKAEMKIEHSFCPEKHTNDV